MNATPVVHSAGAEYSPPPPRRRILVIDDERAFAEMVRLNLERTGLYVVEVETSSTVALATAHHFQPHLILLDVIMPAEDGGDVLRKLRADPQLRTVPVLFLTATVSPRESGGGPVLSAGMPFLGKPIGLRPLVTAIQDALAHADAAHRAPSATA